MLCRIHLMCTRYPELNCLGPLLSCAQMSATRTAHQRYQAAIYNQAFHLAPYSYGSPGMQVSPIRPAPPPPPRSLTPSARRSPQQQQQPVLLSPFYYPLLLPPSGMFVQPVSSPGTHPGALYLQPGTPPPPVGEALSPFYYPAHVLPPGTPMGTESPTAPPRHPQSSSPAFSYRHGYRSASWGQISSTPSTPSCGAVSGASTPGSGDHSAGQQRWQQQAGFAADVFSLATGMEGEAPPQVGPDAERCTCRVLSCQIHSD